MNIAELKAALTGLPDSLMVLVRGYEDGVDEVKGLQRRTIALNVHDQWYYGDHDTDPDDYPSADQRDAVELVAFRVEPAKEQQ